MSSNTVCPKCKGIALEDHVEREVITVVALTVHSHCRKCGPVSEVLFFPDKTPKGKQLAQRLAKRI